MSRRMLPLAVLLFIAVACSEDTPTTNVEPPGGGTRQIDGAITFTDAWSGEWSVTATFRDCETGHIVVVEDLQGLLCEGDSLATGISGLFSGCTGTIGEARLEVDCDYTFDPGDCTVLVRFAMAIDLDGDAISGSGVWSTQTSTACSEYPVGCEEIEISGTRIGPAACSTPGPRLPAMLLARPVGRLSR